MKESMLAIDKPIPSPIISLCDTKKPEGSLASHQLLEISMDSVSLVPTLSNPTNWYPFIES